MAICISNSESSSRYNYLILDSHQQFQDHFTAVDKTPSFLYSLQVEVFLLYRVRLKLLLNGNCNYRSSKMENRTVERLCFYDIKIPVYQMPFLVMLFSCTWCEDMLGVELFIQILVEVRGNWLRGEFATENQLPYAKPLQPGAVLVRLLLTLEKGGAVCSAWLTT